MMKRSVTLLVGKKILLVLLSVSSMLLADISKSSADIVTDHATGLQWQDDYSDNGGTIKFTNWKDAIKYCNELPLDGGGWRLPNKDELLSIVNYAKSNPAISDTFQYTISNAYWTSSPYANTTSYAWNVNFCYGHSCSNAKSVNYYVRCVRSEQ